MKTTRQAGVECINPLEDPRWDAHVARCPGASFFHGSAWARVLHDTYGYEPMYLVAEGGSGWSILPLMEVDSWLTGRRGVSLPFTDECPPLWADAESGERLTAAAMARANARHWRYLELRGGRALFGRAPASRCYYGHTLALQRNTSDLFANCDSAVRRAVRKAESGDLVVRFSQHLDAVRAFHELLGQTRRRHGVPPQPFGFFENVHRHVIAAQGGVVVLAMHGQQPVAGAMFFQSGPTALYKYGASDERFQHLRPNNLVMWRAIEWYAQAGYTSLDFGRTAPTNQGLRRFKLGWGARERGIEYLRYRPRSHEFEIGADELPGWPQRLMRRLPPTVLRLIGAAAYRHVA